jgi:4-hydroxy-2-oxoheptanedioate aldolase
MGDRVGVEAMCRSGLDFVGIDAQHGFFAFDSAAVAIQIANLCGVHCLVRVPAGQLAWIPRYLDAGANGVVVAMVNSLEEAEEAVELTRYQPGGQRSYGGGTRNGVGLTGPSSPAADLPELFVMVETQKALEQVNELSRVPGITGLYVGPVDLGLAMDRPYPLFSDDRPWRAAVTSLVEACDKQGARAGMFATDGEDARKWLAEGFSDVVLSSDIALFRRSLHEHLDEARQPVDPSNPLRSPSFADPYSGR